MESEPGAGSTFRIFLPVNETGAKTEYFQPVVEDQPVRGGTETILIAEDHEGIREMVQTALKALGYQVLLAKDGEEAVAIFSDRRNDISLVLLDVIMPRLSGPEIYAAITAMKPGVTVIFATGYSNEMTALAELVDRGVTILRKPYSLGVLSRRVREVLDHAKAAMPLCK